MERATMTDSTIAFIGLGLIGGSIARAIRETRPDIRIMAYTHSRSRLGQAREERIVDVILNGIDEDLCECDLVFLYTPVEYNASYLSAIRPYLKQGMLITDVGSTKCGIHEEIRRQGLEYCFVGSHPMAGSGKADYESSTGRLLKSAYYIATLPEGKNSSHPQALSLNTERIVVVVKTIGATPPVPGYREHDKVMAAISHPPHLVAFSPVNLIKDHDTADDTMKQVAAGGFRDITQITSSSPGVWEQICMTNVAPILDILEACITSLNKVLEKIKEHRGQGIYRLFRTFHDYRNSVTGKTKDSMEPSYEFTVDVSDEVGAISTISVILTARDISIRDIGINNNRGRGEGALEIAFHDKAPMEAAWQRLDKYRYEMFHM